MSTYVLYGESSMYEYTRLSIEVTYIYTLLWGPGVA